MGAWIETRCVLTPNWIALVAPYMGAWIETHRKMKNRESYYVAPYMGAWIETFVILSIWAVIKSHPIWVRGLKPQKENY